MTEHIIESVSINCDRDRPIALAVCRDGGVQLRVIELDGKLIVQETIEDRYTDQNKRTVHVIEGYLS